MCLCLPLEQAPYVACVQVPEELFSLFECLTFELYHLEVSPLTNDVAPVAIPLDVVYVEAHTYARMRFYHIVRARTAPAEWLKLTF